MRLKFLAVLVFLFVATSFFVFFYKPFEKAKEARDKQRINDLKSIKKAIDFYITKNASVGAPLCEGCALGKDVFAYRNINIKLASASVKVKNSRFVNGTGWIPIDFSLNAPLYQTPLELLPVDPLEATFPVRQRLPLVKSFFPEEKEDFVYTFTPGFEGKYKLTAKMESKKGLEKAGSDGGTVVDRYEIGELSLAP